LSRIVIAALADWLKSVTDVAVIVTVAGFGAVAGAVYVIGFPEALDVPEISPHDAPLQPSPDNVQFTP
jgi:hypothetical protein